VVAVLLTVGAGVLWTQVIQNDGSKQLAWTDVTDQMGTVLWPKSVTRSFTRKQQVIHYFARTFPHGSPPIPRINFLHRKLVLVAAGPRSSTGYGVRIIGVTERRSDVRVVAREITPTLGRHVTVKLTSPYRLFTIPSTWKRVYVQWQGRP
jgi:hypothetical protein